jgi:hypothetical protein
VAAEEPPPAEDFLPDELVTESPQPVRGADDLPGRVGRLEFAFEPGALVVEMIEALAGPLVGAVAAEKFAVGVDQAAQVLERHVEPLGDVVPGEAEGAELGHVRDDVSFRRRGRTGANGVSYHKSDSPTPDLAIAPRSGAKRKMMHNLKRLSDRFQSRILNTCSHF